MVSRIPQEFLDQLLSRVDIVEIVDGRVPLRKAGRDHVACCPFHNEKTPSFTVSASKQFYHCFGCGAHGNAISFLMEYERLGFVEAVEELAQAVGLQLPRGGSVEQAGQENLIDIVEQASRFFRHQLWEHPAPRKAIDYLRSRGLNGEIVKAFGIGYAPPTWDGLLSALSSKGCARKELVTAGLVIERDDGASYDRFRDRIMFPIRDRRGRTIAFGGRALGETKPKYLNSPETPIFHKGRELYGLYETRSSESRLERLLVVEGYMDVVALAQSGIHNAVATLGTATTVEHLERLFRITQDVVFCFDGDRAGRQAAWRALENALPLLKDGRQAAFLFLPEGEDPDTLVRKEGKEAFEQHLAQAVPLSDYFFRQLAADRDATSLDGRARLVERARPLLNRLPDSVYRDMMIQRLADMTGVGKPGIERHIGAALAQRWKPCPSSDQSATRTPAGRAIALLLNCPGLAQQVGDVDRFEEGSGPDLLLLRELIELLQTNPHISVGILLERYRDTETGHLLERVAQWQPEIPEASFVAEFLGALEQLERRCDEERRKRLLDKLAQGELSAPEKEILRQLGRRTQVKL